MALDVDPIELRLLNALSSGDVMPTGQRITGTLPVADVIRRRGFFGHRRAAPAKANATGHVGESLRDSPSRLGEGRRSDISGPEAAAQVGHTFA